MKILDFLKINDQNKLFVHMQLRHDRSLKFYFFYVKRLLKNWSGRQPITRVSVFTLIKGSNAHETKTEYDQLAVLS